MGGEWGVGADVAKVFPAGGASDASLLFDRGSLFGGKQQQQPLVSGAQFPLVSVLSLCSVYPGRASQTEN